MNRFSSLLAGFCTAVLLLLPAASMAEDPPAGIITTQGHGEIKVKPDALSLSVMVEASHAELAKAREQNSRKMQAIIAAVKELAIPHLQMETQNVQVYPMQSEYSRDRLPKTLGYRVTNGLNITVTQADASRLGEYGSRIADAALKAGATHLQGLGFYRHDMTEVRQQALFAAVQDARKNAETMARAAGITIRGVHSMEGTPQYHIMKREVLMAPTMNSADGMPNTPLPVEPGDETITSDVTVRFRF